MCPRFSTAAMAGPTRARISSSVKMRSDFLAASKMRSTSSSVAADAAFFEPVDYVGAAAERADFDDLLEAEKCEGTPL